MRSCVDAEIDPNDLRKESMCCGNGYEKIEMR